ncbi:Uncharacterized protein SCF082_LOCUS49005 [Durusdinium trenchii]|uniref:Fanconi-associated nuclease n=1 Tax=Durusdinium trenchii TaxID=1381693 RepID=A0ABP0RWU2_9DINO
MGSVAAEEYVRTSRQVVFKIQRAVNRTLVEGGPEDFFEDELIGKFGKFAEDHGANPTRIARRHKVLSNVSGKNCLGGIYPTLEVETKDLDLVEDFIDEGQEEAVARFAQMESFHLAKESKYFVIVSRRAGLKRLHMSGCHVKPGRARRRRGNGGDPDAVNREFVSQNMDSDLQFILGDSVSIGNQAAIARRYGSLRKFSALGDDRASIRTACLHDFAIPQDTPQGRAETAAVVSSWEIAKEFLAKEVELRAEAKVLGQPRILQIHERQAMLKAVEAVYGTLGDSECPAPDYLSLKAEETEANEPTASPLDEIISKQASSFSQLQSAVDSTGLIRVTRAKGKSKMPVNAEEYRKVMKVEMYAWLSMASRCRSKHWLHGLTAEPFTKFVEYILGERVLNIQIPTTSPEQQQRVKPDWTIVLAYEHKLRREAMKLVINQGHTLADALPSVIRDADLKEAFFATPVMYLFAGKRRHSDIGSFLRKAEEQGKFLFERPEDLGVVHGEHPGSVWQWPEIHELIVPRLLKQAEVLDLTGEDDMAPPERSGRSACEDEVLAVLRREWAGLLPDPEDALVVDQGQPFLLRGLAQWLKVFSDPDTKWLVDVEDSFASGVCLGVCPPKVKHRKVDDSDFCPIAQNYASADMSSSELETKFREEEALGRMFPSKMGVLREQYGDKLRIASMAAIKKPDGTDNWLLHMIYVDDLHGAFIGQHKFWLLWIWLLAFELVGVPFGYHKFHGGFASEFVGFHLRYDLAEVGISEKRGQWLLEWIAKTAADRFVVVARSFIEFLGRLGFVSQLLVWLKPCLSPLFAWAAVVAPGTVGKLPDTVILTLKYIDLELKGETFLISVKRPVVVSREIFRTDAKRTDDLVVLGGWKLDTRRWFSLRSTQRDVPFFFQEGKGAMWASTSAELLASLVALGVFGWITQGKHRKSVPVVLAAGTDNRANDVLSTKRTTTKWPLMAINMQLSSAIAKARLSLDLRWRAREENEEADSLTNEVFDAFDLSKRIPVCFSDIDLSTVFALWETKREFEELKERDFTTFA